MSNTLITGIPYLLMQFQHRTKITNNTKLCSTLAARINLDYYLTKQY